MALVETPLRDAARTTQYAVAVLLLTSVHHAYGAYVYHTPWRYHALPIAAVTGLVILGALRVMRSGASGWLRRFAGALVALTIVAVPIVLFGAFEGLYNHGVKNLLYFGGASAAVMARLFPAPRYELPNDVFFEITGILQIVPAAAAAWYVSRMSYGRRAAGTARIEPGSAIAPRELVTIDGLRVSIPDPGGLIHLQFRRFAGCPVCSLHLRSFVRRRGDLADAGIREVVVFHSPERSLRAHEGDLPFAVIADPAKRLYREFAVESSPRALLDVRAWLSIVRAVLYVAGEVIRGRRPIPPIVPEGGSTGLPADFLIATDGRVLASKYGRHADDQWAVEEVLGLAERHRTVEASGRRDRDAVIGCDSEAIRRAG